MKKIIIYIMKIFAVGVMMGYGGAVWADVGPVSMSTIATTVDNTVSELATVMVDVSLLAGIGFVLAAFFKFHQHKQNPQQVQLTQGVSLLLIGCGLTLIPLLIPTASTAVLGSAAKKPAQIGGADIHNLIGGGS